MVAAAVLADEKTWLETEIVPLSDTVRLIQSSPERSSAGPRGRGAARGRRPVIQKRSAGVAILRLWCGRSLL